MRLREEIEYPARMDAVFAMLCDPEYRRRVCEATYALDHRVSVHPDGDGVTIRVLRVMPADVPAAVRPLVGDRIEVEQVEWWSAPDQPRRRRADLAISILGQPAQMPGTFTLVETGDVTRGTVEGDIRVGIPFFGGRLAEEMARGLRFALAVEAGVAADYLST